MHFKSEYFQIGQLYVLIVLTGFSHFFVTCLLHCSCKEIRQHRNVLNKLIVALVSCLQCQLILIGEGRRVEASDACEGKPGAE